MIACHFKVKIDGDEAPHDFLPCYVMSYLPYLHDRFMLRGMRRGGALSVRAHLRACLILPQDCFLPNYVHT